MGSHFLPPPWRPAGQLQHTVNCFAMGRRRLPSPLQLIDGVCSLFLSLPWSVRGESHLPSLLSANTPMAVAEPWTMTADHQLDLRLYRMQHRPKLASSTSPQKPPTTYTRSTILDHIGTRFLWDDLYARASYTRVYTVTLWMSLFHCHMSVTVLSRDTGVGRVHCRFKTWVMCVFNSV